MLSYIIRLDDATPKMNPQGWQAVEDILDKYGVKPIVGIIPDNRDPLFTWPEDPDFWTETVQRWQNKGWTIAMHGCHHVYHNCIRGGHSEFIDLDYDAQKALIHKGYDILRQHGADPDCFFAPGHSFDEITVDVCRDSGFFRFISDGYALYPFRERDMLFFPSIFDTPHRILPFGVYTFVLHPSFTPEKELRHFERFLRKHHRQFRPIPEILEQIDPSRTQNRLERQIHPTITALRRCRNKIRGFLHGK